MRDNLIVTIKTVGVYLWMRMAIAGLRLQTFALRFENWRLKRRLKKLENLR
jgi:hypothetical protein